MKQRSFLLALVLLFNLTACMSDAQDISGLWLITNVTVGDQQMTPVAKWTRIHSDGSFESGNGWLKNSSGTWTFDQTEQTFLPQETNGLDDPYGAFNVDLVTGENGQAMQWSREEDGMMVEVLLEKIEEIPMAPADKVRGLWDLSLVKINGADSTSVVDPDNQNYIFIRWDRIYVERTPEGARQTGYWHMNGHRPELTFLPHGQEDESSRWMVNTNEINTLVMTQHSEENGEIIKTYTRLNSFPD